MGPENFDEIAEWLMALLKSETTKVQRSGAAQGLAELIAAFGNFCRFLCVFLCSVPCSTIITCFESKVQRFWYFSTRWFNSVLKLPYFLETLKSRGGQF
jgi:hypothetical protein